MRKLGKILAIVITIGFLAGIYTSSMMTTDTPTKCERTEEAIKNQTDLKGAIACFPPGVIETNQSERVEQGSQLECVCRRSYDGRIQIWAINRAN